MSMMEPDSENNINTNSMPKHLLGNGMSKEFEYLDPLLQKQIIGEYMSLNGIPSKNFQRVARAFTEDRNLAQQSMTRQGYSTTMADEPGRIAEGQTYDKGLLDEIANQVDEPSPARKAAPRSTSNPKTANSVPLPHENPRNTASEQATVVERTPSTSDKDESGYGRGAAVTGGVLAAAYAGKKAYDRFGNRTVDGDSVSSRIDAATDDIDAMSKDTPKSVSKLNGAEAINKGEANPGNKVYSRPQYDVAGNATGIIEGEVIPDRARIEGPLKQIRGPDYDSVFDRGTSAIPQERRAALQELGPFKQGGRFAPVPNTALTTVNDPTGVPDRTDLRGTIKPDKAALLEELKALAIRKALKSIVR